MGTYEDTNHYRQAPILLQRTKSMDQSTRSMDDSDGTREEKDYKVAIYHFILGSLLVGTALIIILSV